MFRLDKIRLDRHKIEHIREQGLQSTGNQLGSIVQKLELMEESVDLLKNAEENRQLVRIMKNTFECLSGNVIYF